MQLSQHTALGDLDFRQAKRMQSLKSKKGEILAGKGTERTKAAEESEKTCAADSQLFRGERSAVSGELL